MRLLSSHHALSLSHQFKDLWGAQSPANEPFLQLSTERAVRTGLGRASYSSHIFNYCCRQWISELSSQGAFQFYDSCLYLLCGEENLFSLSTRKYSKPSSHLVSITNNRTRVCISLVKLYLIHLDHRRQLLANQHLHD